MRVELSDITGVTLASTATHEDLRGSFSKLWDEVLTIRQVCVSENEASGTLRGLHVQIAPSLQTKHLWCARGRVFDVLVDTREEESTFGSWAGVELDGTAPRLLTVPAGVAHGFQTLEDHTTVVYLIDGTHAPQHARTIRWNDPRLDIGWPRALTRISEADAGGESWRGSC